MCVCNRSPGCVIWTNYEVVGLQPRSGITLALDSVAYCSVPIPCLPWYSSPRLIHRTGSSAHLGIARLCPSISGHRTRSSTHLGVARLRPSITDFLLWCPRCYPQSLLRVPLTPSPPPSFPWYFIQVFPKLCFRRLLVPPCAPPVCVPLIALLSCAHFKNWLLCHPLWHQPLSSPYVGHLGLGSRCFPHYFCPAIKLKEEEFLGFLWRTKISLFNNTYCLMMSLV